MSELYVLSTCDDWKSYSSSRIVGITSNETMLQAMVLSKIMDGDMMYRADTKEQSIKLLKQDVRNSDFDISGIKNGMVLSYDEVRIEEPMSLSEFNHIEKCYEDVTGEALSNVIHQLDLENQSLAFSVVEISSNNNSIEAFTSRLVDRDDLESSDIYNEFIEGEDDGTINVSIQSYCIGDGESVHATDDEAKLIEEHYEELKSEFGIDYLDSELISIDFENEYDRE